MVEGISDASFFCAENSNHFEKGKTMISGLGHIDTKKLSTIKRRNNNDNSSKSKSEELITGEEKTQNIIRQSLVVNARSFDIKNGDLRNLYDVLKILDEMGWD